MLIRLDPGEVLGSKDDHLALSGTNQLRGMRGFGSGCKHIGAYDLYWPILDYCTGSKWAKAFSQILQVEATGIPRSSRAGLGSIVLERIQFLHSG